MRVHRHCTAGNVPAYIGLDVSFLPPRVQAPTRIVSSPGSNWPLYNPTDSSSNGLQVPVQGQPARVFMNSNGLQSSTTAGTYLGGSATSGTGPITVLNMLVSKTPSNSGGAVTFTVDYNLEPAD